MPNLAILFSSYLLNALELPNCAVMVPMTRSFSPGGVPTAEVTAYYRRRAENGVSLIITDRLNLNRVFPGDPDGSPTQQIADYVTTELIPLADTFMDLHSGGYSMHAIPTAIIYRPKTDEMMARIVAAAEIWGCQIAIVLDDLGERRTIDAICRDRGLLKLGTELAGAAGVSIAALAIAETGIWRLLKHFGVLATDPPAPRRPPPARVAMRLTKITGTEALSMRRAARSSSLISPSGTRSRRGRSPVGSTTSTRSTGSRLP